MGSFLDADLRLARGNGAAVGQKTVQHRLHPTDKGLVSPKEGRTTGFRFIPTESNSG